MSSIPRRWRDAVLDALSRVVDRQHSDLVSRQALVSEELDRISAETQSQGQTPGQTLSRVLQELEREHLLERVSPGHYRLLAQSVQIEQADLSDDEIDRAIESGRLRLGEVQTGSEVELIRKRRGQDRVRAKTLYKYVHQCAVCDICETDLLVASHIRRWADDADARGRLENTICLCRPHDALFECGYWSLTDGLCVVIRPSIKSGTLRTLLPASLRFRRPSFFPPDPEYLSTPNPIGFALTASVRIDI
jgi:hypothetical protein